MYYVQSRAGPGVLLSQFACYTFLQTVLEAEAVLEAHFPQKGNDDRLHCLLSLSLFNATCRPYRGCGAGPFLGLLGTLSL